MSIHVLAKTIAPLPIVAVLALAGCGGGGGGDRAGVPQMPDDGPPTMMPGEMEGPGSTPGQELDISELLTPAINAGSAPGLFAAIIDEQGVRAIGAEGIRRQGHPEAVSIGDILRIGSETKAMTSTMLATLVEDGTFVNGWNTTIADVFPELLASIHQDYHSVTVSELVRMRSGIARNPSNWNAYSNNPDLVEQRYNILRDNLANAPAGAVGDHLYSNLSYMVAGAMAEKLTGKSWETLMEERLFTPLGMTTVVYGPQTSQTNGIASTWGHRPDGSGGWIPVQFDEAATGAPAGSNLHMSIQDWAQFISLWFTNKEPAILNRRALNELSTPHSGNYAAGWNVHRHNWAGGTILVHAGSSGNWQAMVWIAPERGLAYVALANARGSGVIGSFEEIIASFVTNEDLPGGVTQTARDHEIQIARDDGVSAAALRNDDGDLAGLKVGNTALSLDFHRLGDVTGGGGRESVGSVLNSEDVFVGHIDAHWNRQTDTVARFDHMSYGAWATGTAVPRPGGGVDYTFDGVGGAYLTALDDARTPAAAMPVSGTATYLGQSIGFVQGHGVGGDIGRFIADVEMTADFANAAMTVDMLTTRGMRVVLGGAIQGNAFSGSTIQQMSPNSLIEVQGATAQMMGGFYGTDAVEAGGVYEIVGGRAQYPGRVVGAFGGRKDQ